MSFICEFCNKELSSLGILKRHQKTTKYCLSIQKKEIKAYKCKCNKEFNRLDNYKQHTEKCNYKPDDTNKTIDVLLTVVKDLIANKSSVTNNTTNKTTTNNINIINNLIPLDTNYLKQQSKLLTLDYINDGPSGYARFIVEHLLKDRAICTDVSRKTIIYKGLNNKQIVDVKGLKVSKKIGTAIIEENTKLCSAEKLKLMKEFETNYEMANQKMIKYCESDIGIKKMSEGKDTKFKNKIIDDVCSHLKSDTE